ncbi:MAG: hypothetical protein WBI14_03740 [Anaerolineaceae bacterium]
MKQQISSERFDWFFLSATISSYTLGFIFANRVNKSVSFLVTIAGLVLLLFFYIFNRLISEVTTEPVAGRMDTRRQINHRNLRIYISMFLLSFVGVGSVYVMLRFHSLQGQALIWLGGAIFCQVLLLSKPFSYTTIAYRWLLKSLIVSPIALFLGSTLQGFSPSTAFINLGIALFLGTASAFITLMFRQYAGDLNRKQHTFLVSISWEKGLMLHHVLFAGSVAAMVIYVLTSNSANSNWPAIAWQVFGVYEVYLLEQLAKGVKPNFVMLDALAIFRILGTLYLLIYALLIY